MLVVVWVVEGTWRSCVTAARVLAPADADFVLLHVTGEEPAGLARGAFAGLLGRGHPERDPGGRLEAEAEDSARELLRAAAERLSAPCTQTERRGRVEREVVTATEDADLLVLARDGDPGRLGPRSIGPATRFVIDHAPCPVLLVWPGQPPGVGTIPSPPPSPPPRPPQPRPH